MASMLRCETCNKRLKLPFFGRKRFCDRSCLSKRSARSTINLPFEKRTYAQRYNLVAKEQKNKCGICGRKKWLGKRINFDYDHIDGNHHNNKRKNSRLVCPNCHSQTHSFRGRNSNFGGTQTKATDKQMIKALKSHRSIRAALISLGMAGKGGNYMRCYKLKAQF